MLRLVGIACTGTVAFGLLADPGPARRATFPGPSGQLAYTLSPSLYVVNPDGSGRRAVTAGLTGSRALEPAWAPDGNRIAFLNVAVNGGIWVIGADGTGARRVTTNQNDHSPAWSPDGRRIAFTRNQGRYDGLYVVNADGTGLAALTNFADLHVSHPDWSPDGSRIAFSTGFDIYVVNADGSGRRLVTVSNEIGNANYPSWSPDGGTIAYSVHSAVEVIAPDGSGRRVVTAGLGEVWQVSWSPDAARIAFVNDAGGPFQEELYVVNADGSGQTRLGVDSETTVAWGKAGVVPPPVVGVSVNVTPVSGVVRVRVRGTNRFVNLARLRNVPVGSEFDVTRGRVRLTSAAGAGRTQTGVFYQGRGIVRQARARMPVTTLTVSGPLACPRRSPSGASATTPPRRRLWGNAKGRFSTRGRFASAAVRGTIWLTEDRCDGTLVRVTQGRVQVRDTVRNRTITLRAGQSYLARARR